MQLATTTAGGTIVGYWLGRCAFLEIGYRIWDVTSGEGESNFRFSDGTEGRAVLNEGRTTRQGLVLGLRFQF